MSSRLILAVGLVTWAIGAIAVVPSAPGSKVFFVEPKDGAVVEGPVHVKFGIEGMEVVPAGIDKPHSGHHHLIVDGTDMPAMDAPFPKDATHMHFGAGQTEAMVPLAPGKHTLQMVFGDKDHRMHHTPLMSEKITITVK